MMTSLLVIGLLGIVSSIFTEIVSAVNKKLSTTPLKGDGAFITAFLMAFIGAAVKVLMTPNMHITSIADITMVFGQIFAVSQTFYLFIYAKLGMDVRPTIVIPVDPGIATQAPVYTPPTFAPVVDPVPQPTVPEQPAQ